MNHFIILDIETTGFSPKNSQITEIGAIKVDSSSLEVIGEMSSLIKIDSFVPPVIVNLTGITDELLEIHGRSITPVMKELSEFCGSAEVYAHNANFDKSFIRQALSDCNIDFIETDWGDTLPYFRKKFPNMPNHKLETLIKFYGLAEKESHRAIDDAKHTLELIKIAKNL
ncbi:MAG: 3'-5' exonuclease [Mycoplasma sp.]|nr:3'-5' exonuclease [Mycoplasma sp.]